MNEIKHTHTHTQSETRSNTHAHTLPVVDWAEGPRSPLTLILTTTSAALFNRCPSAARLLHVPPHPTPSGTLTHDSSYPIQVLLIELDVPLNTKDPPVETQHPLCADQIWNLLMGCRSLRGGCGQRHHPTGRQSNNNPAGICACIIDVLFNGDEPDVNLSQNLLIFLFFFPLPFLIYLTNYKLHHYFSGSI